MNYRHAFHAGNPADVMKHAVLVLLLERLTAKPAPFCVLDTHAGIGRYDLAADAARRTGEADRGIGRVLAAADRMPPELEPYLAAVRSGNPDGRLGLYPGSPWLVRRAMRPGDRLVLAELHPEDATALRQLFRGDDQVAVHHMDGWLALKAHLPPREKRGLVLVDPPFEAADDYDRLVEGLRIAHRRWSTGIYALWYPVKDRADVWRLHQGLEDSGIPRILAAEMVWDPSGRTERLAGSGLVIVNPPWQLDAALMRLLHPLHALFTREATAPGAAPANRPGAAAAGMKDRGDAATAGVRVGWISPEPA